MFPTVVNFAGDLVTLPSESNGLQQKILHATACRALNA